MLLVLPRLLLYLRLTHAATVCHRRCGMSTKCSQLRWWMPMEPRSQQRRAPPRQLRRSTVLDSTSNGRAHAQWGWIFSLARVCVCSGGSVGGYEDVCSVHTSMHSDVLPLICADGRALACNTEARVDRGGRGMGRTAKLEPARC